VAPGQEETISKGAVLTCRPRGQDTERCTSFEDPEEYLKFRRGKSLFGLLKRWSEERAMDRALAGLDDIAHVCDIPCGPGRLFGYWHRRGYRITGMDVSEPMVRAARRLCEALGPQNRAVRGDAFALKDVPGKASIDMVASVRFFYYFNRNRRIRLLQNMAGLSRKYLLVQYKTTETWKGGREVKKIEGMREIAKQYCSNEEIRDELTAAGLECIRIVPISQLSDRIFVSARKMK
jgi:SAM-dependent methyltransferase